MPLRRLARAPSQDLGYDSFKSVACKAFKESDAGLTIVASASHNSPETDAFCAKYKNHTRVSKGSSLKLLMVAEGSAHIYPRLAPTMDLAGQARYGANLIATEMTSQD